MISFRRIVVATDFSGCADAALALGADLAMRSGGELELLHVCEMGVTGRDCLSLQHPLARAWRSAYETSSGSDVVRFRWLEREVAARTLWAEDATEAILDRAALDDIDMLVLGTHGWHSVRRFLNDTPDGWPIGQTARMVLPETRCPVLAVGPQGSRTTTGFRQVVAPVDDSPHASGLAAQAGSMALFYGVPLVLLHVLPRASSEQQRADARRRLSDLARAQESPGLTVEIELTEGRPAEAIVRDAIRRDHPLVMLASHGNRGRGAVSIGSVADAVTRSAPCPVLTVKTWGRSLLQGASRSLGGARMAPAAHQARTA